MMGHNICFKGVIWKIIPKLFHLHLLIWSTGFGNLSRYKLELQMRKDYTLVNKLNLSSKFSKISLFCERAEIIFKVFQKLAYLPKELKLSSKFPKISLFGERGEIVIKVFQKLANLTKELKLSSKFSKNMLICQKS